MITTSDLRNLEQSGGIKEEWQRDKDDAISVPLLVSEAAKTKNSPFFLFEPSGISDKNKGFLLGLFACLGYLKNLPFLLWLVSCYQSWRKLFQQDAGEQSAGTKEEYELYDVLRIPG
ncbi:MAG: hypothetical protein GY820_18735 [Gammaproteobacteria bacterium]|nr:hypothetical protein [Gammaproteobacteria bacterium]